MSGDLRGYRAFLPASTLPNLEERMVELGESAHRDAESANSALAIALPNDLRL
jgi:hypothetical protein